MEPVREMTACEELFAIAVWRRVLADLAAGRTLSTADYAALFPMASDIVRAELDGLAGGGEHPGAEIGHYRLVEPLGRGGQGSVWMAEDLALGNRRVALKLLPMSGRRAPTVALRLRREVELGLRADVPGVCPVFDTGLDGDFAWIAMRLVDGRTLAQLLESHPGAPEGAMLRRRLEWVERVARIVNAVHVRGVLHRDLKPGNVMIDADGECVVLDFGVARAVEGEGLPVTATGAPLGTPAYMAPEQIAGAGPVGPQADVWALGVILFECATGTRPFLGVTPFDLQRAIVDQPVPTLRQRNRAVPRDLELVVATALQKDPVHRYSGALDFAEDVRRVREHYAPLARRPGALTRAARFARRRPGTSLLLAMLAMTVVTALAVGSVLVHRLDHELQRADSELKRADRAQRFVDRFADMDRLQGVLSDLADVLAIDSRLLPRFQAWTARADELVDRLPSHRAYLEELRALALPNDPAAPLDAAAAERVREAETKLQNLSGRCADYMRQLAAAEATGDAKAAEALRTVVEDANRFVADAERAVRDARGYRFTDADLQVMHDRMQEFVTRLVAFAQRRPGSPTRTAGTQLWKKASAVHALSIDDHGAEWREAVARIAAPDGRYRGLAIVPQEGLVPLGPDPESHLEEFALLNTGVLPGRDASGQVVYSPDTAVVLVLLPGGTATVGAAEAPPGMRPRFQPMLPRAEVPLEPFFVGKHEVTQAQWFALSWYDASMDVAADGSHRRHPVEYIQWYEAFRFARRLQCALPSEAQWEYACRAGTATAFSFGDDAAVIRRFGNVFEDVPADQPPPDGHDRAAPVGSYRPNGFGLFDLHGNVREWTSDAHGWYDRTRLGPDGRRPPGVLFARVVRGGSFLTPARDAQCWWRRPEPPDHRLGDLGFRVVRAVMPTAVAGR